MSLFIKHTFLAINFFTVLFYVLHVYIRFLTTLNLLILFASGFYSDFASVAIALQETMAKGLLLTFSRLLDLLTFT